MNLDWCAAGLRGEKVHVPAPGFTLRDLPRVNQMICRTHHCWSSRAVLTDFQENDDGVVALVRSVSDDDLITLGRYS